MSYGMNTEIRNNVNLSAFYSIPSLNISDLVSKKKNKKNNLKLLLEKLENKIHRFDELKAKKSLNFECELELKELAIEIKFIKETIEDL